VDDPIVRRRVLVEGRVQGVWFRDSTRTVAERRGVAGWVANRRDGAVEAVLEGPLDAVLGVVEFCRSGPPRAVVLQVTVTEEELEGLAGFTIR